MDSEMKVKNFIIQEICKAIEMPGSSRKDPSVVPYMAPRIIFSFRFEPGKLTLRFFEVMGPQNTRKNHRKPLKPQQIKSQVCFSKALTPHIAFIMYWPFYWLRKPDNQKPRQFNTMSIYCD